MKTLIALISFTFLLAILPGCGNGKKGGGSGKNGGANNPKNKEEALSKLSPAQKLSFDRWQDQVVKACDASDAFGLNKDNKFESDGIDGAALIKKNSGSVVFSDNNDFLVLTSYDSFSGTATTKVEKTQMANGHGSSISAETKREGSFCTVFLFGQKVFETTIAKNFIVGTHWMPGKEAKATSSAPLIKRLGSSEASEVVQSGLYKLISQTFKPTKEAIALLSKKLGLNEELTSKLFKLSSSTSAKSAVRIDGEASSIWSNQDGDNIIAKESILRKFFDGGNKSLPLELRLAIPEFSFSGIKNDSDSGNIKLVLSIEISKNNNLFLYSTQSIQSLGFFPFDKAEALSCARDRAMAYFDGANNNIQIQPTVETMFSPCRSLYVDVVQESYDSGLMKSLVAIMFAGVNPSAQYRYGGWDEVLSSLALDVLSQDKDIRQELDRSNQTKLAGIIADHLEALKQELGKTRNTAQSKDFIYRMGLDWSFRGEKVSQSRIDQILTSIDNSIDTFKVSSEQLLTELGRQPNALDDRLAFAKALDITYKTEAMRALALSKDLSYSDFERNVFNQVIQLKVRIDEFKDWSKKFVSIKTEISKYPSITPVKGELVGLSIKWLKSGEAGAADLSSVYSAINNSIVPFEESSKELVRALSDSLLDNREALDFARSLTAEYKQLAATILSNSKAAEYEDWGKSFFRTVLQKRPSIEQLRSWGDMWSSALAFTQREKARTKDEFGSTNEWNRKKIIEVAVEESWSNKDFTGLEIIAEVARAKNTCDHYKGYSSLAACAGLRLFSKKKTLFFDPAFQNRYIALGRDFASYMSQLSGFDWTSIRWALVGEFFGSWEPIWSKCDQASFNQKASVLKTQVNAIVRETDQFKKWELERQIKDTIRSCQ